MKRLKYLNLTKEQINHIKKIFLQKYSNKELKEALDIYFNTPTFKINENVFNKGHEWNDKVHYLMRLIATEKMKEVFNILKIDLNDPNVEENLEEGNIGTPGRIIKMWSGADTHDDRELLGGRFHEPVRIAKFPNDKKDNIPIIKEIDLTAVCSHHLAPFSTLFSNKARVRVAYIPGDFVIGISKLQRLVRQISQRGWLQEDLTKEIYNTLVEATQTEDVYIQLKNIKHSCEFLRGAMTQSNGFTTEYYGGRFKTNPELLKMVRD